MKLKLKRKPETMMMNPYTQSYFQPQMPMQQVNLNGRMVNDFNEISANDVPMNGNYAYFPKADMSEIQIRRWTPQGTIENICFKPYVSPVKKDSTSTDIEILAERVTKLENAFNTSKSSNRKGNKDESTSATE